MSLLLDTNIDSLETDYTQETIMVQPATRCLLVLLLAKGMSFCIGMPEFAVKKKPL